MRGESARPGKRPLRALSASEKMDAIQRVHEGESKASVARDIGVPESTLRGWCKSEHKIRGMARNSSTPDSEAHSPASSSGANNSGTPGGLGCGGGNIASGSANLSSEDEGGPPTIKRSKLDRSQGTPGSNSTGGSSYATDCDELKQDKPKIDYVGLMTSMAAGMRPENSSLLLQQLGLLSGATGTLAKNLLGMSPGLTTHGAAAAVAAAAAAAAAAGSPVGLVENGLQYTKSAGNASALSGSNLASGASNGKRHGISAIAPTQMDSVVAKSSCARKSLPPAAEAPSTPVPASPRKTNENGAMRTGSSTKSKRDGVSGSGSGNKKIDEALWLWLTQQQQLLGQQSATFNPSVNQHDGSWFWQWYKQCSFPLITPTPVTPSPVASKKSPSKARALLDNVLCNNNNENVKRSLNMDEAGQEEEGQSQQQQQQQQQVVMSTGSGNGDVPSSTEEAIEHGEKFFKWLDKCSEPAVTRLQIMQFKYLLDNLKACRKKSSSLKQSRK